MYVSTYVKNYPVRVCASVHMHQVRIYNMHLRLTGHYSAAEKERKKEEEEEREVEKKKRKKDDAF